MAPAKSPDQIQAAVEKELAATPYRVSSLEPLMGGTANFIYRAKLQQPLSSGVSEVLVKHGEGYVAQHPDFALTSLRCEIEFEAMKLLSSLPHTTSPACEVGTPVTYYFDARTSTQVQEYLRNATSLKDYALKHYKSPTPSALKPQCLQLGDCLGQWLRAFHDWSDGEGKAKLHELFARNAEMQGIKKFINYDQLRSRVQVFPSLLEEHRDVLQKIVDMATAELRDEGSLKVIHGDFWTGNVLLPDQAIEEGKQTSIRVVDWEMAQVGIRPEDLGQLIAELWQLKLYKDIDAGVWMIQGFVDGYGKVDADFAFRTLLHVGAHLVCFGSSTPNWGTPQQNEEVARKGRDVLLSAWGKDMKAFQGHDLECLLS